METELGTNTLKRLYELGQSPWYDNIDRRLLISGAIKGFIEKGILGLTSNPTIFEKAVAASDIYKEKIRKLKNENKSPREIYDEITANDVRSAADLLNGIYIGTKKIDGYVSIEVYPEYAHDTERTIIYAKNILRKIGRRNIMIKVPGTKEGFDAVRMLTRDGINVNVTLLFSVGHYEKAALSYIEGLRDRLNDKRSIEGVVSVASVFVSRVDTAVDKMLAGKDDALRGQAAVANAKMIYQRFGGLFKSKEFGGLKKGAFIQRPLWASTGTKDPAYSDVKYVEELIGKDTINTMPQSTMEAFLDHGRPRLAIEEDAAGAGETAAKLGELGIDITRVCQAIQDEGVEAFRVSFDKLIEAIKG